MPDVSKFGKRWQARRLLVLERDGWACQECGCDLRAEGVTAHVDHVVSRSVAKEWGWPDQEINDVSNLRALCSVHNLAKGDGRRPSRSKPSAPASAPAGPLWTLTPELFGRDRGR